MGVTAAITAAAGAAIFTGTKLGQADKRKAQQADAQQQALLSTAPNTAVDQQNAAAAAQQARAAQRRRVGTRRATLLTGPMGIPDLAPTTRKTLLGS
jgi:Na+-translocating ferredoxin:NAD+ oxidoreductase RnfG subunit